MNLLSAFSLAMGTSHWVCVIMYATEPNKRSEMRLEDVIALTIQEKSSWQLEGKSVPRNLFRLYLRLVWERKGFSTLKGSPERSLKESQDKENGYLSFSPQNLLPHSGCGSTDSASELYRLNLGDVQLYSRALLCFPDWL